MSPVEFEPTIPGSERRQTHALHHAATGIGAKIHTTLKSLAVTLSCIGPVFSSGIKLLIKAVPTITVACFPMTFRDVSHFA
jgi:hypothetical protein